MSILKHTVKNNHCELEDNMYIMCYGKSFAENTVEINHQVVILMEQKLKQRSHTSLKLFQIGKRQDKEIVPLF